MTHANQIADKLRSHPLYTRVTIVGLLLFTLGIVLFMVLSVLSLISFIHGTADQVAFFVIFPVLALVVAGLTWWFGTWALALAAAFSAVSLGMYGPLLAYPLGHPSSAFDFVLSLMVAVGMLLGLVAGTIGFMQQRRGVARATATRAERKAFATAAAVLVGLGIFSGILAFAAGTTVSVEARAGAIEIDMRNILFEPDRLEIQSGESVRLLVKNSDFTLHTFTLESLEIDKEVMPRSELVIEIATVSPGNYQYICAVPSHEDMTGTLVVK